MLTRKCYKLQILMFNSGHFYIFIFSFQTFHYESEIKIVRDGPFDILGGGGGGGGGLGFFS